MQLRLLRLHKRLPELAVLNQGAQGRENCRREGHCGRVHRRRQATGHPDRIYASDSSQRAHQTDTILSGPGLNREVSHRMSKHITTDNNTIQNSQALYRGKGSAKLG